MRHETPIPDIDRLNRLTQSLRLWVLELVAYVGAVLGLDCRKALRGAVREACAEAKCIVVAYALHHGRHADPLPSERPWRARRGCRYTRTGARLRAFTRGVAVKSLRDLRALFDDLDRAIAAMLKRFRRARVRRRLVAVRPRAEVVMCIAWACAPDGADTS